MTRCEKLEGDLALYAGGDLSPEAAATVREHLDACPECQAQVSNYQMVTELARSAFPADLRLGPGVVTRIAARAAEPSWWWRLVPGVPGTGIAAVVPAMMMVVAVALPLALRPPAPQPHGSGSPARLDLEVGEGGAVHLAWMDGHDRSYKVFKSTDPRQLGRGPGQVIHGNEWVDVSSDSAPIIYYRIE